MDEKKHANKLAAIYSDIRINPIQLAHLTVRMFTDQMTSNANEWHLWHSRLYDYEMENQMPFDLSIYD